jgi:hypothetical protein
VLALSKEGVLGGCKERRTRLTSKGTNARAAHEKDLSALGGGGGGASRWNRRRSSMCAAAVGSALGSAINAYSQTEGGRMKSGRRY